MVISDFAIKRPLVTVVVMLCLVLFGVLSLLRLETDEFPEISPPFLIVGVPYPGGSPDGVVSIIVCGRSLPAFPDTRVPSPADATFRSS